MATKKKSTKVAEPTVVVESPKVYRTADALIVLIEEVAALFPETSYELGLPNKWGVIGHVTFETHGIEGLFELLGLLTSDPRVMAVTTDARESLVEVGLHPSLRTMDSKEPFGLGDAWVILSEEDEQ